MVATIPSAVLATIPFKAYLEVRCRARSVVAALVPLVEVCLSDIAVVAEVHEVSLVKVLQDYCPVIDKGQLIALENREDCEWMHLQEVLPGAEGYLEAHPEGADRGGYVPMVFLGKKAVYWDPSDTGWQRC